MDKYTNLNRKLFRFNCVSIRSSCRGADGLSVVEYDDCLSGSRGEIWPGKDTGSFNACLYLGPKTEEIYFCDIEDLRRWLSRIDYKPKMNEQEYWANNPNARHPNHK